MAIKRELPVGQQRDSWLRIGANLRWPAQNESPKATYLCSFVFICVSIAWWQQAPPSTRLANFETQMNANRLFADQLSKQIIGCALVVSNALGAGFLEKVYENALAHELRKASLFVEQQHPVTVYYDGAVVGSYSADLLAEKAVLVELKAVTALDSVHRAQCINYLKGSGLWLCLLLNFGTPRLQIKRVVNDA